MDGVAARESEQNACRVLPRLPAGALDDYGDAVVMAFCVEAEEVMPRARWIHY
jgi:hypothetical protein